MWTLAFEYHEDRTPTQNEFAKMILDRHEIASVHNVSRLPEGSLSVLEGRHGAMNPAGRVRIRNIMPIARDCSRASQSF